MRKKVLLVDPNNTLPMMKMILANANGPVEVITGRDGVDAIVKAHSEKPDVILLDVILPRLSGLTACAAIRRHEDTAHIPIVLFGHEQNMESAFRKGCTDYVTKPIHTVELLRKLQHALLSRTDALQEKGLESDVNRHSA